MYITHQKIGFDLVNLTDIELKFVIKALPLIMHQTVHSITSSLNQIGFESMFLNIRFCLKL